MEYFDNNAYNNNIFDNTFDVDNNSIQKAFIDFFETKSIQEQCTEESLIQLHEAFLTSPNEEMNIDQLYDAFENILHIKMPEDEFKILFRKMNLKRDGNITWNEFISYLLVEFQKKDISLQLRILKLPITGIPQLLKSYHRTAIHKIMFYPEILPDRTTSFHRGSYLTVTKEGIINYWSLDLKYERSAKSVNPSLKVQQTLITDMIVMPDIQIVCTSSTEYDLRFYDTEAKKFDLRIMTYNGLPTELGEHTTMTIVYNTLNRKMIVAGAIIAIIVCDPKVDEEVSDGFTHTKSVSCVLYNHLYKVVVSTGLDSCIIIWDPWLGNRLFLVTHAHSRFLYGQFHDIEITAACFDESEQLLVTGARDGTLKIWHFNTGTCLRNMELETQCEVTSLVWLENRILCSSWNHQVVEFAISDAYIYKKHWGLIHTDDILCSAMWYPQVLATATFNGEIILWRLETGQPYRKYKVNEPMARFRIKYLQNDKTNEKNKSEEITKEFISLQSQYETVSKHQESALNITRIVAVRSMIFLNARSVKPDVGTLLVSLDSGLIQVWTHHPAGGFLEAFSVIHIVRDCALALATDPENHFLVTGHCAGYIKVWYLANYLVSDPPEINMIHLRLEFPFLWKDRFLGRAKRAVKDQPLPLLLSSVRGHLKSITSVQIIPDARIIISASTDHSVRLWTFGGRYISTFGTFKPWSPILPMIPTYQYFKDYRLPPDIKKVASSTTLKVLEGGIISQITDSDISKTAFKTDYIMINGQRLTISMMDRATLMLLIDYPILDTSLPYIPIYTHLRLRPLEIIQPPKLPALLQRVTK
ncbi:WD repeat-containing protein on Y chromosome isoform X9 [Apis laboriosa]|uniref:WD repeat-containing protein on Y chromosome isoform X9 n=1 Tax=Apis laboriosa TaxID=183418 RepID=UPI001CC3CA1A|nr:WD repeat-containing protein on Y chromosome isoform X9 [Apis laboriosa]